MMLGLTRISLLLLALPLVSPFSTPGMPLGPPSTLSPLQCNHPPTAAPPRFPSRRVRALSGLRMNLFDGLKNAIADATREVKVQHILVDKESEAVDIRRRLEKEGLGSFGAYAQEYSTCGSSKKTPTAKMSQLRGEPGELVFRPGSMDKAFEKAAFDAAPLNKLWGPVKTKFGYHLMVVRERSAGLGGGGTEDSAEAAAGASSPEEVGGGGEVEEDEDSKSASKKKSKAAAARLKKKKGGK